MGQANCKKTWQELGHNLGDVFKCWGSGHDESWISVHSNIKVLFFLFAKTGVICHIHLPYSISFKGHENWPSQVVRVLGEEKGHILHIDRQDACTAEWLDQGLGEQGDMLNDEIGSGDCEAYTH